LQPLQCLVVLYNNLGIICTDLFQNCLIVKRYDLADAIVGVTFDITRAPTENIIVIFSAPANRFPTFKSKYF
jgi:hypothetical protein